jgi:hypothetical protein
MDALEAIQCALNLLLHSTLSDFPDETVFHTPIPKWDISEMGNIIIIMSGLSKP